MELCCCLIKDKCAYWLCGKCKTFLFHFYHTTGSVATIPPPVLSPTMWQDSQASSFRVRGPNYITDKVKTASAPSLFQFIGIDLFETPEAQKNIASHPRNRVNMALQRGENSWVFVVNIMVPGDPYLNFVCYFLGDKVS